MSDSVALAVLRARYALQANPSWIEVNQRKRLHEALERAKVDQEYRAKLLNTKA